MGEGAVNKERVFIIPGYTENVDMPSYQRVMEMFRARGSESIGIRIDWKYRTMSDYVAQFVAQYEAASSVGDVALFGFSFGALIALIAATQIRPAPSQLYLCSLSPYFSEDLPALPAWWKRSLGKHRMADFEGRSFASLVPRVQSRVTLVAGSKEPVSVHVRAADAVAKLRNARLVTAEGARHNLGQKEYLEAVRQIIEK